MRAWTGRPECPSQGTRLDGGGSSSRRCRRRGAGGGRRRRRAGGQRGCRGSRLSGGGRPSRRAARAATAGRAGRGADAGSALPTGRGGRRSRRRAGAGCDNRRDGSDRRRGGGGRRRGGCGRVGGIPAGPLRARRARRGAWRRATDGREALHRAHAPRWGAWAARGGRLRHPRRAHRGGRWRARSGGGSTLGGTLSGAHAGVCLRVDQLNRLADGKPKIKENGACAADGRQRGTAPRDHRRMQGSGCIQGTHRDVGRAGGQCRRRRSNRYRRRGEKQAAPGVSLRGGRRRRRRLGRPRRNVAEEDPRNFIRW
jgi:hypothetical protein